MVYYADVYIKLEKSVTSFYTDEQLLPAAIVSRHMYNSRTPDLVVEIRKLALMPDRTLYIVAGCNGAGKTSMCFTLLPEIFSCLEFVNADEIARGLSPFRPAGVSMESGRIMLRRIDELIEQGTSFAFETTLAASIYLEKIRKAKVMGYRVILMYIWVDNLALAKQRVVTRVLEGGHHIS